MGARMPQARGRQISPNLTPLLGPPYRVPGQPAFVFITEAKSALANRRARTGFHWPSLTMHQAAGFKLVVPPTTVGSTAPRVIERETGRQFRQTRPFDTPRPCGRVSAAWSPPTEAEPRDNSAGLTGADDTYRPLAEAKFRPIYPGV